VVNTTIDYYVSRGSHTFVCFIDATKAFDRVNYWKLFGQLLDDNIDLSVVNFIAFWYRNQQARVRWQATVSDSFYIGNGTRQVGVLSLRICLPDTFGVHFVLSIPAMLVLILVVYLLVF